MLLAVLLLLLVLLCVNCVSASSLGFKNGSNEVIRCKEKERQALLDFRAGLTLEEEDGSLPWWNTNDCCEWSGVECSDQTGHVTTLDIDTAPFPYGIAGKANPSLLELRELTYLDLSYIDFENKPIPSFFGSFTKLKHLYLGFCNFSGTIPSQLGNLSNLTYLDLSFIDFENKPIPSFFGSFIKLKYLDLSDSNFAGTIPSQLGNLSNLNYLDLSSSSEYYSTGTGNLSVENIDWLSRLSSLQTLKMTGVDLSRATNWVDIVKSLPFLSTLHLSDCQLSKVLSPSSINSSSTSIKQLFLDFNGFTSSSMYSWLFNLSSSLVDLSLSDNMLESSDLEAFGHSMHSLQFLDLSSNLLQGMIPHSFGNLCNLETLVMDNNSLSGNLSDFVDILFASGCASASTLELLDVDSNKLHGPIPDGIIRFSSLIWLSLSNNQLNGTITKNLGTLSQLMHLDLSSNSLFGILYEAHFSNLSRLSYLDFSGNPLHIKVSPQWSPHFQLRDLNFRSCNLGPLFPNWIRTQKNFYYLDISNNGISDTIPQWLWDLPTHHAFFNLSSNNFGGILPHLSSKKLHEYPGFDLSSNNFEGPIPLLPSTLTSINLSKNKFTGNLDFLCQLSDAALSFLDLSHNLLTGRLPDCLGKLEELILVNLAHNRLSGEIPYSIGSLFRLETLYLYNNTFSGELPVSLSNCKQLSFLDVGENKLAGIVPGWIGTNISHLYYLSLRSNDFFGTIPLSLCQLNELQVLDLSMNNLFGSIPRCLSNLSAMVKKGYESSRHHYDLTSIYSGGTYGDYSVIEWQGRELEFGNTLSLIYLIDLSNNNLSGEIPDEIKELFELVALNLSRNALQGNVPQNMGQLKSIMSLDLSRNRFSGKIPASLSQLNLLNYLDMSYNKFSGKIPSGTQIQSFEASKFIGNVGLCGPPLESNCPGDESPPTVVGSEDNGGDNGDDDEFRKWLYIGMSSGFITGFWGICGALLLNRRGRHAFILFTDYLGDWFYVKMAARRF